MSSSPAKKRFVLVDSFNLIHRAYHAFPDTLRNTEGLQLNAAYGFAVLLLKTYETLKPNYIACAFDVGKPTWRHAELAAYKMNRKRLEDDFTKQIPIIRDIINSLNIPILEFAGYEADDVAGTVAYWSQEGRWKDDNLDMVIVTGDKDILQLVGDPVRVWMPGKTFKDMNMFGVDEVIEKFGFGPEKIPDYKALVGDPSDNIPGVSGIGDVIGTKLVKEYGSIDKVFENLDKVESRAKNKLAGQEEIAHLSKKIATIVKDVPIDTTLEKCLVVDFNLKEATDLFSELGFRTLIPKLTTLRGLEKETPKGIGKITSKKEVLDYKSNVPERSRRQSQSPQMSIFEDNFSSLAKNVVSGYNLERVTNVDDLESLMSGVQEVLFVSFDHKIYLDFVRGKKSENVKEKIVYEVPFERKFIEYLIYDFSGTLWSFGLKTFYKEYFALIEEENQGKLALESLKKNFWERCYFVFDLQVLAYLLSVGRRDISFPGVVFDHMKEEVGALNFLPPKERAINSLHFLEKVKGALLEKLESLQFPSKKYVWDKLKLKLLDFHKKALPKNPLAKLLFYSDNLSIPVLALIEHYGVQVDENALKKEEKTLGREIERLKKEIFESVGHEFNVNSSAQLAEVLFAELKLPKSKRTKTSYSTNEESLKKLLGMHPLPDLILKYREYSKLLSTYVKSLPKYISDDGRVHTEYDPFGTVTGRLSSSNPNMQNIPIRTEFGQRVRGVFVSESGSLLVAADYSQVELRVLAYHSKDILLTSSFESDKDLHAETAARIFKKKIEDVTSADRRVGKIVNFGIVYGQTSYGLAKQLDVSQKVASKYIKSYFKSFPKVEKYISTTIDFAKENGFVETLFGRRRYILEINSPSRMRQLAAQREAINMPIQGTATGDIMRLAMNDVVKILSNKYSDFAMPVMQVHDELVFEVKPSSSSVISLLGNNEKISFLEIQKLDKKLGNFIVDMRKSMGNVINGMLLKVDFSIGTNWAELTKVNFK